MKLRRLELVPITLGLFLIGTFVLTFIVAVLLEHVRPDFPFISDTASLPPESSIFSQCINAAFLLMLACVYLRYLHIDECVKSLGVKVPRRLNGVALGLGAAACFGLDVVANFQEITALTVHLAGALVCFVGGTTYACLQVYFSWKLYPEVTKTYILSIRAVLATLCVILTPATLIAATIAISNFTGDNLIKWRPEDGGWEPRLISAICEWLNSFCYCIYFITFASEFKNMVLQESFIRVELNSNVEVNEKPGAENPV